MKKIIILIYLMILIGQTNAQYLVIDNSSSGGNNIPFQDTLIEPPYNSDTEYYLDLDQDSIDDIKFFLRDIIGGMGGDYIVSIVPYGNFSVLVDTTYQEHYQYLQEGVGAIDTTRTITVVKKYNWGDTIYDNHISTTEEKYLHHYSKGNYPPCIYRNITLFKNDTSFIALNKETNNESYLYYIKVLVQEYPRLYLMFAKSNDNYVNIGEVELTKYGIYPNPASDLIYFKKGFESVQVYNSQGSLILEKNSPVPLKKLNIAQLPSGIYFIYFKDRERAIRTKFIKL